MKSGVAILALAVPLATGVCAAAPKPISMDRSGSSLIDAATSEKVWKENTPARVARLYPARKFRFTSEITGGFNDAKQCIVSARAMLLPVVYLPIQGTKVIYEPIRSASAYDAAPDLTEAQCQALARTKLKESIQSLMSALAAS